MSGLREKFGLMEYSEYFIEKMIDYRMHMDKEQQRYLSYEEIAERENVNVDDVSRVIMATALIWNH